MTDVTVDANSLHSLSYNKFTAPSKMSSQQTAIYCFLFQFPAPPIFFNIIQYCLRLLSRLPVTSNLPSTFPSITCFRR